MGGAAQQDGQQRRKTVRRPPLPGNAAAAVRHAGQTAELDTNRHGAALRQLRLLFRKEICAILKGTGYGRFVSFDGGRKGNEQP
jgi:hypothetical protein